MKGFLILLNAIVASVAMHNGVHLYHDYNQASGVIVPQGVSQGGTVIFLSGENSTLESCEERCATYEKQRCWSFVFLKEQKECYAVLSPGFNPSYDEGAVTGVLDWPCRNANDCSLNGKCTNGTCECRLPWIGHRCETLNLEPPKPDYGYQGVDDGHHTSSWGGAVLKHEDGLWHMVSLSHTCSVTHTKQQKKTHTTIISGQAK